MEMAKTLDSSPLVRVALILAVGIAVGDGLEGVVPWWAWITAAAVALLAAVVLHRLQGTVAGICVLASTMFFGATMVAGHSLPGPPDAETSPTRYEAILMSEPQDKGRFVACDLKIVAIADQPLRHPIGVKATIAKDTVTARWSRLHVGDGIKAISMLRQPRNFRPSANFDYTRWLRIHGFSAQTRIGYSHWQKAAVSTASLPIATRARLRAMELRQQLLARCRQSGLGDETYAVVAAMALGDKSQLSSSLKERYSVTGASHVLALSGLHLGIIYTLLTLLMGRFRRWRWLTQTTIVVAIWAYVVLVGMPTSAVRSATMLSVCSLCMVLGRPRISVNSLALAAVVVLVANPQSLWDVGFQMSFMAVLSILVYYPAIEHLLAPRNAVVRWLWSLTAVSLAAQIGTAPLVAYYFERFSCYFLLTNLIAIPAVTLLLYGAVVLFVATPLPMVQSTVATVVAAIATLLNNALTHIAGFWGASIEHIRLNTLQLYLIYLVILSVTVFIYYAREMHRQKLIDSFAQNTR